MVSTPTPQQSAELSSAEVAAFHQQGFHLLPSFLDRDLCAALKREVDEFMEDAKRADPKRPWPQRLIKMTLEYREHGFLLTEPRLMTMLRQLMGGGDFALHHLHTSRHDTGCRGVDWHHDYLQFPQANRSHLMVHVFFYLNGLDGTIGDLLLMPGSHRKVMECDAYNLFDVSRDLPGMKIFDDLPAGSAIIVHSAVQHARRPKPGGDGKPRYFIDASYCQAGVAWPGYGGDAVYMASMFARAKELGLGRGGRYDFVFDPSHFFAYNDWQRKLDDVNQGSLIRRMEPA